MLIVGYHVRILTHWQSHLIRDWTKLNVMQIMLRVSPHLAICLHLCTDQPSTYLCKFHSASREVEVMLLVHSPDFDIYASWTSADGFSLEHGIEEITIMCPYVFLHPR